MSCLFNSLDLALKITNSRVQICNYIENNLNKQINGETIKNWIIYSANDMNLDINSYMKQMRNSSTWGGGPELMIASKMYNVIIVVVRDGKEIEFNSLGKKCDRSRIIYLNYNGSHYWNNSNENNSYNNINNKSFNFNRMNFVNNINNINNVKYNKYNSNNSNNVKYNKYNSNNSNILPVGNLLFSSGLYYSHL